MTGSKVVLQNVRKQSRVDKAKYTLVGVPDFASAEPEAADDEADVDEVFSRNFLLMLTELNFLGWDDEPKDTREGRDGGVDAAAGADGNEDEA